jgi:hypothetical protein
MDDAADAHDDAARVPGGDLLVAGLVGAAIGAGIGLLFSGGGRSVVETLPVRATKLQRKVRRMAASRARSARISDAGDAVRDAAERAREAFEDLLARESRSLRRSLRRRRRSLGL